MACISIVGLGCVTLILSSVLTHASNIYYTKNLYNSLLSSYDTRIRPKTDQANATDLESEFIPTNIIEFDTTEQKFTVLGYLELTWIDEVLQWDPLANGGVQSMKVPVKEMWKPSIILSKAFGGNGIIGDYSSDIATVNYDGVVNWSPEGTFSFVCEVDIKFYPFDEQMCILIYYVSDETVRSVNLTHPTPVNLAKFIQNSEWDLVEVARTVDYKYEANFININFRVQRRASFTTYTIITPLLMLSFLNVCVFLVPIDSGEKGSFAITIFLSYGIFVTIVSDTLPHNSLQISYFVLFLIVLLLLSVLSVFYTIMQAKVYAAYGDSPCAIGCCKKKSKQEETKTVDDGIFIVQPIDGKTDLGEMDRTEKEYESKDANNEEDSQKNSQDWKSFLEKLDTCLFVAFFTLVSASAIVFFALMMQRFGVHKVQNIV